MLIVGERINTSRKQIAEATETQNRDFILSEAKQQEEAGAHFIDVNAGTFAEKERENLLWLVETLHDEISVPLCIDSSDPDVISDALSICAGETMVNSITAEREKYEAILPIIKEKSSKVIALFLDDEGIPEEFQKKIKIGFGLLENLLEDGIEPENIYADPLAMAVGTTQDGGIMTMRAIQEIRKRYADIHIITGLSNISFGVPVRSLLNGTFLAMAMTVGLDAAILDPLDRQVMASLVAANAILGNDRFCRDYLTAYRSKKLQ